MILPIAEVSETVKMPVICVRNRCYVGEGREEGDGVFDVSVCQHGAPIVLSWPHFLGAEHKYRDAVEGLNPEKVKKKL